VLAPSWPSPLPMAAPSFELSSKLSSLDKWLDHEFGKVTYQQHHKLSSHAHNGFMYLQVDHSPKLKRSGDRKRLQYRDVVGPFFPSRTFRQLMDYRVCNRRACLEVCLGKESDMPNRLNL